MLDRPDKMNAMSVAMVRELMASLDAAETGGARALLVRGEGRAFCSGRDLSEADPLHEDGEAILRDELNPLIDAASPASRCRRSPRSTAPVSAPASASRSPATSCTRPTTPGSVRRSRASAPSWTAARTRRSSRGVGPHRALELVYTGRLLSGREAAEWGLVNRSVAGADLVRRTREMARAIARGPTAAFLESKRIVRLIQDGSPSLAMDLLAAEAAAQGRASRTHDYQDGISAFLEKRKPAFTGR